MVAIRKVLNRMNTRKVEVLKITLLATSILISGSFTSQALANKPAAPAAATPAPAFIDAFKELKALEKRFFIHEYDHDPPEKRVERLELFIFGSAQSGKNDDRLKRIKEAVAKNDQEAARAVKAAAATAPDNIKKPGAPTSSAQYPVLNTLEWRVLKKTHGSDSLDARLDRLETQLFGQPSQAMAYTDRIERLKKMTGIFANDSPAPGPKMSTRGPLPKAYGRGSPFSYTVPFGSGNTPFITPLPGSESGTEGDTFDDDFRSRVNIEMPRMMQQMREMMRSMPGGGGFDFTVPYSVPSTPGSAPVEKKPKIPPYADPNSI